MDLLSLFPVPPPLVVRGGLALRRALHALADLITPTELVLTEHMSGVMRTQMLGACARLDLARLLAGGPKSSAELAAATKTNEDALHRLLRGLAAIDVLQLRRDGRFAGTRTLRALEDDAPRASKHFAQYWASRSNVHAWNDLFHSLETGESGFIHTMGCSIWDWFDAHPDERETFARAMGGLTYTAAPLVARLYPWSEVERVCDVGGGRGMLLAEILSRHPHLKGVLVDAQGVLDTAPELLDRRGVTDRVERVAGSFFDGVPAGADAYLLKNILHDWDDARSIHILKQCRAAMRAGGRVVIVEMIVEHDATDLIGTLSDLQMMVVCDGGRERGIEDLRRLLEQSGFRLGRAWPHPLMGVVEGVAV